MTQLRLPFDEQDERWNRVIMLAKDVEDALAEMECVVPVELFKLLDFILDDAE